MAPLSSTQGDTDQVRVWGFSIDFFTLGFAEFSFFLSEKKQILDYIFLCNFPFPSNWRLSFTRANSRVRQYVPIQLPL